MCSTEERKSYSVHLGTHEGEKSMRESYLSILVKSSFNMNRNVIVYLYLWKAQAYVDIKKKFNPTANDSCRVCDAF